MKKYFIGLISLLSLVSCSQVGQLGFNIPRRATDPNAITFDDGDFSFAKIITDDRESANGSLSVVEIHGNNMLKFSDDMTSVIPMNERVQKVSINVAKILGTENLPLVRSIEFDVYADALTDGYINAEGQHVKAPGTICCGGGTVVDYKDMQGNRKWYDFAEFQGGEYNLDMSGAVHGEFKFFLAESGLCWSENMDDANFLIMRWGIENVSNFYIDNIVFYDIDGNSIPIA